MAKKKRKKVGPSTWKVHTDKLPKELTDKELMEEHALLHRLWETLFKHSVGMSTTKLLRTPEWKRFIGRRPYIHIRTEQVHREMAIRGHDCVYKQMNLGYPVSRYWDETYATPPMPEDID